jgi:phospholipid/cholesterol/gamma-HCH transport system permease protein
MDAAGTAMRWMMILGQSASRGLEALGDQAMFAFQTWAWLVRRLPSRGTVVSSFYAVGVRSVPVVAVTGLFIGMVLAVQSYRDFNRLGFASRLGAIINISVVRELGPVLAATMIAGRVGSAMAAEIGTMRVTEQIEALMCLGANPVHYLVVPRFLACLFLVPLLTVLADVAGIVGGAFICLEIFHVQPHYYWLHAREYVGLGDILNGLFKSMFFGTAISLISCHRGFTCRPGAEGVGRAATQAFVFSFLAILVLDFFLALFLSQLSNLISPVKVQRMI